MAQEWTTVSIPFVDGISPSTRDRLLPATKLLALENGYMFDQREMQKRAGHDATRVRTSALNVPSSVAPPSAPPLRTPFSYADPKTPDNWLFGYGLYQDGVSVPSPTAVTSVSPQNEAGLCFDSFTRDNETVAWDGFRTFSYTTSALLGESYSPPNRGPAVMPQVRTDVTAKVAGAQVRPDAADNGTIRVVCWLNPSTVNPVNFGLSYSYSVFDSLTGACLVDNKTEVLQSAAQIRCLTVGGFGHIFIADATAGTLEMRTFHQDTPNTVIARNFATRGTVGTQSTNFDVRKVDETEFMLAYIPPAAPGSPVASVFLRKQDGSSKSNFTTSVFAGSQVTTVALAATTHQSPQGGLIVSVDNTTNNFVNFDLNSGAVLGSRAIGIANTNAVTLTSCFPSGSWDIFAESTLAGSLVVLAYRYVVPTNTLTLLTTRYNSSLASQAFTVGSRCFVWLSNRPATTLQVTNFLVDEFLLPIGKMNYAVARPADTFNAGGCFVQPGVNFTQQAPTSSLQDKNRYVWCGCLSFRQRVENTSLTYGVPTGLFAEPSIRFYTLDFLAPLYAAQAGRSAYIAGAQLWEYDGTELNEAGFHCAPEGPPAAASGTVGLPNGTYRYRIDLCYKNAQNEEVRSWSLIQPSMTTSLHKNTITINTFGFTRREDSYFLVYRNQTNGTQWFLVSSRDPSAVIGDNGFVKNDLTVAQVTFTDNLADTSVAAREYHPANAGGNYLDPLPAPPCQVVSGGAGRLWVAGGELNPGEIAPSRQFAVGESPTFHPVINLQIDRNIEPITAICFVGDLGVVFRRTSAYFLETDGPDNTLNPTSWQQPRLAMSEMGCINQKSVAVTTLGIWFQSVAGLRLLSPGGGLDQNAGQDVDALAGHMNIAAAVVAPDLEQIRFYSRDDLTPTLIYNYNNIAWSTWTGVQCVGASYWAPGGVGLVTRANGYIWTENKSKFLDAGNPYEFRVRTSWQHSGGLADFQRFRRFAFYGLYKGPHTLRYRLFYNEEPFWREEIHQVWPPASVATLPSGGAFAYGSFSTAFDVAITPGHPAISQDMYGSLTWGSGSWGDASNINGGDALFFRNGVYRDRRRPKIQKCSVFSIELSDMSAPNNSFVPVALGFELGKKTGLDRIPEVANS